MEYCIIVDQRDNGLRSRDIKRMAFQLAIRNGLKHTFNQANQHLGINGFDPF